VEIAIVIGGGNIFRGATGTSKGVDRVTGDTMGASLELTALLVLFAGIILN